MRVWISTVSLFPLSHSWVADSTVLLRCTGWGMPEPFLGRRRVVSPHPQAATMGSATLG